MCWKHKPRSRKRRRGWLKRFVKEQRKRLARGFAETFYGHRHWSVERQAKQCLAWIAKAERELEAMAS